MRGNRVRATCTDTSAGSIPAHAGEPTGQAPAKGAAWVYPRACGGTTPHLRAAVCVQGLSPRMRGNLGREAYIAASRGSIPAHAGEPIAVDVGPFASWVYPRACGGTARDGARQGGSVGLSPRMRGNRQRSIWWHVGQGSIPAHAGEPGGHYTPTRRGGVYPRACGGTSVPRVPAECRWVYPRACGGTQVRQLRPDLRQGLSPRMRGNRVRATNTNAVTGSIPAHAGEPVPTWRVGSASRVYPRACGGTHGSLRPHRAVRGLSPRMRGNLVPMAPPAQ